MFKVTVSGLHEATHLEEIHTKIIGLLEPSDRYQPVITDKPYHLERFHDIESPLRKYILPEKEHIERVLNFSKDFNDDDRVLIHCQAGISRSSAVCILVLIQHGMTIKEAFDHTISIRETMCPNRLILSYGDELLVMNGEIVNYYDNWLHDLRFGYDKDIDNIF